MSTSPSAVQQNGITLERYGYEHAQKAAAFIRSKCGDEKPKVGVVCGSGFGGVAERLENLVRIPYKDIPDFPISSVSGHKGVFIVGDVAGKRVACMQGRTHPYEGHEPQALVFPIRVMRLLGVETMILTNAAGAVNPKFAIGDLMLITDHIFLPGLGGASPLRGPNDERFGTRFPSLVSTYDAELLKIAHAVADRLRVAHLLQEGVYVMTGGPQYETPAEARFLHMVGGDALGMSTCHEAIAAKHCGMRVFGLSLLTNKVPLQPVLPSGLQTTHDEVLQVGKQRQEVASALLIGIIEEMTIENATL